MDVKAKESDKGHSVVDMCIIDNSESEENDIFRDVPTQNRFEVGNDGRGSEWRHVRRNKRKKVSSSGSIEMKDFDELSDSSKLTKLFQTVSDNKDMLTAIAKEQSRYHRITEDIQENIAKLNKRSEVTKSRLDSQAQFMKTLAYRSIDTEARSRRNNVIVWGITEKSSLSTDRLVMNFFEDELDLDTTDMVIDRAHRIGSRSGNVRNQADPKRPIVIRFRNYPDTDVIMRRAYKLKGTPFGLDRDYPMEIAAARRELYKSQVAQEARASGKKVQITFPAKLVIDSKLVKDKFPDWQRLLREDRMAYFDDESTMEWEEDETNRSQRGNESDPKSESDSESGSSGCESGFDLVQSQTNQNESVNENNVHPASTQSREPLSKQQSKATKPKKSDNLPASVKPSENSSVRRQTVNSRPHTPKSSARHTVNKNTKSKISNTSSTHQQSSTQQNKQSKNRHRENPTNDSSATTNIDNSTRL